MSTAFLSDSWTTSIHSSMAEISSGEWNSCVGSGNPYIWHSHLLALEESGIATPENGFNPRHIMLRDQNNQVVAVAPAYLKDHSEGELGVDLGLAMAHNRAVGPYYPKLQVEVPMTPISGPRLLVRDGENKEKAGFALLTALRREAEQAGASSVQIAYMTASEWNLAASAGFINTEGNAFVWRNHGVECFEDFLSTMDGRKRSKIRRERRKVASEDLTYVQYDGAQMTPDLTAAFFDLYAATYHRNSTALWHNQAYFQQIFETMPEAFDLTFAYRGEDLIAMQFSFLDEDTIYAQHWGQSGNVRFLLFELGIYQTIELAIRQGKGAVNLGTTGQHKTERGFGMEPTYHSMWFCSEEFREIAELGLKRKQAAAWREREGENARLPLQGDTKREGGA